MVYYFQSKFPKKDELVLTRVINIDTIGITVELLQYNNIQGFINLSELSRKKKFNINNIVSIDKPIILVVLAVDQEKGYIDLSKRTISNEEVEFFNEQNKKYLFMYNTFKKIFNKINKLNIDSVNAEHCPFGVNHPEFENYMTNTLWRLQNNNEITIDELYSDLIDINKNEELLNQIEIPNFKTFLDELLISNNKKLTKNINISLISYEDNGVKDIKNVFTFDNIENYKIVSKYLTNSNYNVEIECDNNQTNINSIDNVITTLKNNISLKCNEFNIKFKFNN